MNNLDRQSLGAESLDSAATGRATVGQDLSGFKPQQNDLLSVLRGTIDALDECAARLLDKTPDLVEPQLDAMSDEEASDHSLFHQVIKPAQERALRVLRQVESA